MHGNKDLQSEYSNCMLCAAFSAVVIVHFYRRFLFYTNLSRYIKSSASGKLEVQSK